MQPNTEQLAGILTDGVQFSGVFRPEITGKIHPARQVDDPDAPQTFPLQGALTALRDSDKPAVRAFVRDELAPLLENTELLRAYTGLMVGG